MTSLLDPVSSTLTRLEGQLRSAESAREAAFAGLREQVGAVAESARGVAGETRALTTALRTPHVRGRWGEMQLERVVHLAGMVEHCDFTRQSVAGAEGAAQRPDLVVHLAGGKRVVVDAKVPCEAYLESLEAADEAGRRERTLAHARQLRTHVDALSAKAYWRSFDPHAGVRRHVRPGRGVPLRGARGRPGTAGARVLRRRRGRDARPRSSRCCAPSGTRGARSRSRATPPRSTPSAGSCTRGSRRSGGHLGKLGRSLDAGVRAYNDTVGSLESRVLVTARRFSELSVTRGTLDEVEQVDRRARVPGAPELTGEGGPADGRRTRTSDAEQDAEAGGRSGRVGRARGTPATQRPGCTG